MRFGGGIWPFSEYEAGVHAAPDQGVSGFFIPCRRTRPCLEGDNAFEEAPTIFVATLASSPLLTWSFFPLSKGYEC